MKLKIDTKSIRFKVSIRLIAFAVLLIVLLCSLQIIYLNNFYQSMKESRTNEIMDQLKLEYDIGDMDTFCTSAFKIARDNDIFLQINYSDGSLLMSSGTHAGTFNYTNAICTIYEKLRMSGDDSVSFHMSSNISGRKFLACGQQLTDENKPQLMVYILSPLWLTSSTIEILEHQIIHVSIIALIFALVIALYISSRISTPIRDITKSASKLSGGETGITFHGGAYTEIDNLAETLNKASFELEKSASLQKDLIANVSHDLKTPLTMIKSYAEMIRDISGDNPEKRSKHLQVIIEESDRLNLLVSDLLSLTRLQSGAIEINPNSFDLHDTIKSIITSYNLLKEDSGYTVNFICPENLTVKGDPERIKQVFTNLIDNALKFCGEDKTVNITVKRRGRIALCSVQDYGCGIPPEDLEYIWKRYYKSSSNTARGKTGSGLGLSIVKEILILHKVRYGVESRPDEGTTFWFELPLD